MVLINIKSIFSYSIVSVLHTYFRMVVKLFTIKTDDITIYTICNYDLTLDTIPESPSAAKGIKDALVARDSYTNIMMPAI